MNPVLDTSRWRAALRRGRYRSATIAASIALALIPLAAPRAADETAARLPKGLEGVGFDQRLGSTLPLDLGFVDESGAPVRLGSYFGQRPVIVTLNYYDCPMLCTLELNGLVKALRTLDFVPGRDFEIVTVSIDPKEGPELAAAKKAQYTKNYAKDGAASGWHFLTGTEPAIHALAESVGFRYRYDEPSGEYAHAAGVVIATPDGRASRYLFGVELSGRDLRLALVESSAGKIGTLVDQILLFCFHYDPAEARYAVPALMAVRAGGAVTVIALGAFVIFANRKRELAHGV